MPEKQEIDRADDGKIVERLVDVFIMPAYHKHLADTGRDDTKDEFTTWFNPIIKP